MNENINLIHLKRITGWNKPNYNPQNDEFFIEDALWSISKKITPYDLSKEEKECLTISLKKAQNRKTAYQIINKIIKHYSKQ